MLKVLAYVDEFGAGVKNIAEVLPMSESEETRANARLIAAAPEMLEALEWYVKHDDTNSDDQYYMSGKNKACAIIAKVKSNQKGVPL